MTENNYQLTTNNHQLTMDIKTYRAKTMRDALELVRRELGPSASVLHTRELNGGPLRRLVFGRKYEVAASATVNVPSRLAVEELAGVTHQGLGGAFDVTDDGGLDAVTFGVAADANLIDDYRARYRDDFRRQVSGQLDELHAMVEKLCLQAASAPAHDLPESLFHVFTNLIEAEVDEAIAREWIDQLRGENGARQLDDVPLVMQRLPAGGAGGESSRGAPR